MENGELQTRNVRGRGMRTDARGETRARSHRAKTGKCPRGPDSSLGQVADLGETRESSRTLGGVPLEERSWSSTTVVVAQCHRSDGNSSPPSPPRPPEPLSQRATVGKTASRGRGSELRKPAGSTHAVPNQNTQNRGGAHRRCRYAAAGIRPTAICDTKIGIAVFSFARTHHWGRKLLDTGATMRHTAVGVVSRAFV
jgi:hypothetical protein